MDINFYSCSDDPRKLNKSFTSVLNVSGAKPFESMSITAPSLILKYNQLITTANYFYIEEFGRYYKITGINLQRGGRMVVTGEVDVLSSFRDKIRGLYINVERYEKEYAAYIPDTEAGATNAADVKPIASNDALLPGVPSDFSPASQMPQMIILGVIGKNSPTT